jgi:MFS family permease
MTYGILFSIGLYFKPLETEFNWSRTQISIAISISMIVFGIFQPIVGRLIDKLGPKKVIASSVFILGLSLSLMSYISNLWEFYLVFGVLAGLGFSGSTVLSNSVIVSGWFTNRRGKA